MAEELIKKDEDVRVRIAPSPTGAMHVGTARTALFNYLFAKHHNGVFLLRIEDTDVERSDKKSEKDIFEGLEWLGIRWDEEPITLRQSERGEIYQEYINKLLERGSAFYCPHTSEELKKEGSEQLKNKETPRHTCSHREEGIADRDVIKKSIIRFKNDSTGEIKFYDHVRGEVVFKAELLGDFSVAKAVDRPLYNLAVVIDDYDMEISHVIRGEDHLPNTPKQILLQTALDLPKVKYIHIPLLLGTDKSKLSKRHGALSVNEYRQQGYLAKALFNFLALLGWRPQNDKKEIMTEEEIIKEFGVNGIQKGGAIFDIEKLNWMNGMYIRNLKLDKLAELCTPYLEDAGFIKKDAVDTEWLKKVVAMEQDRIKKLSEIAEAVGFIFKEVEYDKKLLVWKKAEFKDIKSVLNELSDIIKNTKDKDWTKEGLESIIMPYAEKTGNRGEVLWPLRVAVSGKKASPGPFEIMEVLGKETTLNRVEKAVEKLND